VNDPNELLTAKQVGVILRMHPKTVMGLMRSGRLIAVKGARNKWTTTRRHLDRFLERTATIPDEDWSRDREDTGHKGQK
jgi:hypothetical protein